MLVYDIQVYHVYQVYQYITMIGKHRAHLVGVANFGCVKSFKYVLKTSRQVRNK